MTPGREKRTLFSSIPPQPAYRRQPTKGKPLSAAGRQGWPSVAEGTVCPFTGASEAWRGGDRRPAGGGSSDAARTLVPAKPGQREGVALCRAAERRQEDVQCNYAGRQGGLSQRGVRGCRGQGAAKPLPPAAPPRRRPKSNAWTKPPSCNEKRREPKAAAGPPTPPGRSSCALRGVEKAGTPKRTRDRDKGHEASSPPPQTLSCRMTFRREANQ